LEKICLDGMHGESATIDVSAQEHSLNDEGQKNSDHHPNQVGMGYLQQMKCDLSSRLTISTHSANMHTSFYMNLHHTSKVVSPSLVQVQISE